MKVEEICIKYAFDMDKNLLKQIVGNTQSKSNLNIVVSGRENPIVTTYKTPILLNKTSRYEIALTNLDTYYSFPNIDETNNQFKYRNTKGQWKMIRLETRSYEITGIQKEIRKQIDGKEDIILKANRATLKCGLSIRKGCMVNFKVENSISSVLGFDKNEYGDDEYYGEHIVNIMQVNTIMVNLDIITDSYVNGTIAPVIYNFFPKLSPGVKIVQSPINLIYLPIIVDTINQIKVLLTDQNHKPLDFRGEKLNIRFHLREC